MEQVKRQTVNELGAIITEWAKRYIDYRDGNYNWKTRKILKKLADKKWDDKHNTACELAIQCKDRLYFCDFEAIASIVFDDRLDIPNREEVFCKILALLGVEVTE